jgi:NADPH-dependent 2,4-dienoyl-CoA reductase/sulfur reductase-like enzyme
VARGEDLIAYPADEFIIKRGIDLRLGVRATEVDLQGLTVTTSNGDVLDFDALIYTAGAQAIVPPIPGVEDPRVVTVRRLEDAFSLNEQLKGIRRAVVVGAGYVGLEMAEALTDRAIDVTIIDRLSRVLTNVDEPIADIAEEEVRRHCTVRLGAGLVALHPAPDSIGVELEDGVIDTDLVVLALGVRPETSLVSGLDCLPNGALLVDEQMRTSHEYVWAAGDCVGLHHRVLNRPAYIPLGPAANKAGRVAGVSAAGGHASFPGVVGTAVVKVFNLTVAHSGLTLGEAQAAGLVAQATEITAKSRAKYYPGALPIRVRLVHEIGGRLLGGQLAGQDGVAQRIDVVAAALHAGMTIDDLADLDLAYAPPFSPVYDPLTQAAQAVQFGRARHDVHMKEGSR